MIEIVAYSFIGRDGGFWNTHVSVIDREVAPNGWAAKHGRTIDGYTWTVKPPTERAIRARIAKFATKYGIEA